MRDKRVDSTPLYSAFLSGKRSPKQSKNSTFCHLKSGYVWDAKEPNDFWLPYLAIILLYYPSRSEESRNFVVVQGVFRSCKICSSRAPGGHRKNRITHKIKITFQKVQDNFACMKKSRNLLTQMSVTLSVC